MRPSQLALFFALSGLALGACERTEGFLRSTRPPTEGTGGTTGSPPVFGFGGTSSFAGNTGTFAGTGGAGPTAGAGGANGGSGGAGTAGEGGAGGGGPSGTLTNYGPYLTVSRGDVISASATCATKIYASFATTADAFVVSTNAVVAAPLDGTKRVEGQQAYARTMMAWGEAEVIAYGPGGGGPSSVAATPGGRDLGIPIYGWPLVSRCEIDKVTLAQGYQAPDFNTKQLITGRTLAAIDYLLFHPSADQGCGPGSSVAGPWNMLGAEEIFSRRAQYIAVLAADASTRGHALEKAWSPSGENFESVLTTAGKGSSVFPTEQLALNAISDALFVLDTRFRDVKLSHPLGLIDCPKASCPEDYESQWAGLSRPILLHNLIGFRRIVTGCDEGGAGVGFDDLLSSVGQPQAADTLRQLIETAIRAAEAVPDPSFVVAAAKDPASIAKLRADVNAIVAYLKSDFLTLLDLELPKRLEGDND